MKIKFLLPDGRFAIQNTDAKLTKKDVNAIRDDRGATAAFLLDGEYAAEKPTKNIRHGASIH